MVAISVGGMIAVIVVQILVLVLTLWCCHSCKAKSKLKDNDDANRPRVVIGLGEPSSGRWYLPRRHESSTPPPTFAEIFGGPNFGGMVPAVSPSAETAVAESGATKANGPPGYEPPPTYAAAASTVIHL